MCCLHQKQVLYTRQTLLILSTACTITLTGQRILQTVDFNISYYRYCAWDSVSHLWSLITCNSLYRHTLNEDIFQKEIKCPACVSMAYSNVWMTIISQVSTVRYMRKSWACLQMQIFGSIERQRQQNLCPRLMIRCWVVPFLIKQQWMMTYLVMETVHQALLLMVILYVVSALSAFLCLYNLALFSKFRNIVVSFVLGMHYDQKHVSKLWIKQEYLEPYVAMIFH